MEETKKKPSKAQLEKRIEKAVLLVDKSSDAKEVYFADRGLRIAVSDGKALVSQGSFTMVFDEVIAGGYSRNYAILASIIMLAEKYDCMERNSKGEVYHSFAKLVDKVNDSKEENADTDRGLLTKFIVWYELHQGSMWLMSERVDYTFALGMQSLCNNAIRATICKPYGKDMTNKELFTEVLSLLNDVREKTEEEYVVLHKETEEERKQAMADALNEQELEEMV